MPPAQTAGRMRVLLTTTRSWHLDRTALAFSAREALAGFWMADRN